MSDAPTSAVFEWTGSEMRPLNSAWAKRCDQAFIIGERYLLEERQERSSNSHRHYFSMVREGWMTLPEHLQAQYPSPESLRKRALIQTGWCDSNTFVCASKAEAQRLAAFMAPIDEFSVVIAKDATVTRYVAKSQSMRAMSREDFERSKADTLAFIASLLEVPKTALATSAA